MDSRIILFCLLGVLVFLTSCNEIKQEKKESEKEKELFYMINLPDTINVDVPVIFEIKLKYPIEVKEEDYFSHLILSDNLDITLDNILEKKGTVDNPYEIMELSTDHWKVRRTFYERGDFTVKGVIYVSALDIKDLNDGSFLAEEHEDLVQIERKVYVE